MEMTRGIMSLAAGLSILAGIAAPIHAADSRFAGFLVDRSCAENYKAQGMPLETLQNHKKECALNESCSHDGYALCSKGQWYFLDKKGNELARQLLKTTHTKEGHFVFVSGNADKDQIKVATMREMAASSD